MKKSIISTKLYWWVQKKTMLSLSFLYIFSCWLLILCISVLNASNASDASEDKNKSAENNKKYVSPDRYFIWVESEKAQGLLNDKFLSTNHYQYLAETKNDLGDGVLVSKNISTEEEIVNPYSSEDQKKNYSLMEIRFISSENNQLKRIKSKIVNDLYVVSPKPSANITNPVAYVSYVTAEDFTDNYINRIYSETPSYGSAKDYFDNERDRIKMRRELKKMILSCFHKKDPTCFKIEKYRNFSYAGQKVKEVEINSIIGDVIIENSHGKITNIEQLNESKKKYIEDLYKQVVSGTSLTTSADCKGTNERSILNPSHRPIIELLPMHVNTSSSSSGHSMGTSSSGISAKTNSINSKQ